MIVTRRRLMRLARGEAPQTCRGVPSMQSAARIGAGREPKRSSPIILRNSWAGAHQLGEDTVKPAIGRTPELYPRSPKAGRRFGENANISDESLVHLDAGGVISVRGRVGPKVRQSPSPLC